MTCSAFEMHPDNALRAQPRKLLPPLLPPLHTPTFLWILEAVLHMFHCPVHFFAVTDVQLDSSHSITLHGIQLLGATLSLVLEGKKVLVSIWLKSLCRISNAYQLSSQAKECTEQSRNIQDSPAALGRRGADSTGPAGTPFLKHLHLTMSPVSSQLVQTASTSKKAARGGSAAARHSARIPCPR